MKPFIIGNWKANKTEAETREFATKMKKASISQKKVEVILCPSFTSIRVLKEELAGSDIKIGAQDVSNFVEGAYTGEVTAKMLKDLVSYCIVGHSERRKYFGENDQMISEKVERLLENNITPVLCISDLKQMESYISASPTFIESSEKIIFVYEPPNAISSGGYYHPESAETASEQARKIKEKVGKEITTLYGGSVSQETIKSFLNQPNLAGVLVGKASLNVEEFLPLIQNITA
jgi:triosephosphate isomerase